MELNEKLSNIINDDLWDKLCKQQLNWIGDKNNFQIKIENEKK